MALAPEIDLVLLFVPSRLKQKQDSKPGNNTNPQEELLNLINTLTTGGLNVTARPAVNGAAPELNKNHRSSPTSTHSHAHAHVPAIYIFVSAPPSKLAELYNAQAHTDFLLGVPTPSWRTVRGNTDNTQAITSKTLPSVLPPADRIRLVHEYITSLKVEGGLGIVLGSSQSDSNSDSGLDSDSVQYPSIKSIFALHDQRFNRRWFESWTRQRRGFHISFPELCKIRDQFGEATAFYFAFLSSYTSSLFIPALLGFLFWFTTNPYSLLFSSLLTLWSISWVEWWRVREKILAVRWGTLGSFKAEKRRVGFRPESKSKNVRNDVTSEFDDLDAAFPWYKRELRILASVPIIILFGAFLAIVLTGIFVIEAFVTRLYHGPGSQYVSLFPTVLFVLFVPTFINTYQILAGRLANWENHAHDSEFDNSLTLKTFALSSIIAYLGLALSAFLYVPFGDIFMRVVEGVFIHNTQSGEDHSGMKRWGFEANQGRGLDTDRLQKQMFYLTVTNQVVNTLQEVVLPYVLRGIERYRSESGWNPFGSRESATRSEGTDSGSKKETPERRASSETEMAELTTEREWEAKFLQQVKENVLLADYTPFSDYSEMVTQFGYVALWSTIWPLAPVMSFLNNWFEMRSDAFKIMTHNRRPLPKRVESIGAWLNCMAFISWLGTLTNAALVYLFHPDNHAVLSSRFGTALRAAVPGSIHGGSINDGGALAAQFDNHTPTHLETHAPPAYGDFTSTVASTWHLLLMPALLVTLASSHGYIVLRAAIRHVVQRAVWRGSREEREIKRTGETTKQAYLGMRKDAGKDGGFAFPSGKGGVSIGVEIVGSEQHEMSNSERLFWERDLDEAGVWSAIGGKED